MLFSGFKVLTTAQGYFWTEGFHLLLRKVSHSSISALYAQSANGRSCDGGAAPVDYNYTLALPNAKRCEPVSYPGAGHSLNFALNAQGAFQKIADCLTTHGL
jgi:hypothetical protein